MAIEQMFAVNPFGNGVQVDKVPENILEVEGVIDEESVDRIACYCRDVAKKYNVFEQVNLNKRLKKNIPEILNPMQIQFLSLRLLSNQKYDVNSVLPWIFNYLMQKYYGETNKSNFTLDAGAAGLDDLCNELKGKKEARLSANIIGNANRFGRASEYADFAIGGNAGSYCGQFSKNCNYLINEGEGGFCGSAAQDCIFTIKGETGCCLAESSIRSYYSIEEISKSAFKYYGKNPEPQECTFATEKKEVYEQLKLHVPKDHQNNAKLIGKNNIVLEEVQL